MGVFISYHTQSDGTAVRKICEALEGAGISCWYAPRNVGANYAQSIVEAIRGCRVFILVLNKESNLSAHVLNEVNCAFDRFRNHEDITLLPFRIDDRALSDDVYYYWRGAEDFDVINELIKKSWVIHNPATDEAHLHPLVADPCQEKRRYLPRHGGRRKRRGLLCPGGVDLIMS